MEHSTGRVTLIGVPPRQDGANEKIQKLNSLLALEKGFGYKFFESPALSAINPRSVKTKFTLRLMASLS